MSLISRKKNLAVIATSFILFTAITVSGVFEEAIAKQNSSDSDIYSQLKIFSDVIALIQKDYVKEVKANELIEGAIKGMISSLDPHSSYLDPEFYEDLQVHTKGEFGGLGLEITVKDGLLVVVTPMESGPADKAGIQSGDAIVKIDGKYTKELSMVDAVKKLRGPKGTKVSISVFRKTTQSTFDVTLTRDVIQVKSVRSRYLNEGYGYVKINQFMETSSDDLYTALRKTESQSEDGTIHGLILDLRNNPGGLLNQAVRICDMFLKEGVIVYTEGRIDNQKQKFFAHDRGTEKDYPLVVLVNGGSASASEIVSGALKEHGRAVIVGTRTFGKGSVQTVTKLENGGALSLTTALYYLKNGESIQLKGVEPDIEVDIPPVKIATASQDSSVALSEPLREGDLPGAIANPNGSSPSIDKHLLKNSKISESKEPEYVDPDKVPLDLLLKKDPQLSKAFEVLKGNSIK